MYIVQAAHLHFLYLEESKKGISKRYDKESDLIQLINTKILP